MPFLPISKQDMKDRGIDQLDFICVTGDAYVDHPSFGIAIISRMLESCGCNVGIIAQPVTDEDFKKLGEPKYCNGRKYRQYGVELYRIQEKTLG